MSKTEISVRPCKASDLFNIKDGMPAETLAALDEYFSAFSAPIHNDDGKPVCPNCGGIQSSFMGVFGIGVQPVWGIAHGEASCSGCGWPMRGMHRPRDGGEEPILSLSNFFLSYHPSQVSTGQSVK